MPVVWEVVEGAEGYDYHGRQVVGLAANCCCERLKIRSLVIETEACGDPSPFRFKKKVAEHVSGRNPLQVLLAQLHVFRGALQGPE